MRPKSILSGLVGLALMGMPALAQDAPPIALGGTTPHPRLLALGQRVLEACVLDAAFGAHLLGDVGVFVTVGVEDARFEPAARAEHPPLELVG